MSSPYPNFGEPAQPGRKTTKRRWLSKSDEEIAEEMDTVNLPYRAGWPNLPPLPVNETTQGARVRVHDPEGTMEAVQVLCAAQKVYATRIYFAYRIPKVREYDEDYLTLVIAADLRHEPVLFSLILQIRKHLQRDVANEEIAIEIIDDRVVHGFYYFAIPRSDENLLNTWHHIYEVALTTILESKERFLTMELLYRGFSNDRRLSLPTLVITSPTAAKDVWTQTILPSIRRRINAEFPSLKVELLCGSNFCVSSSGRPQHAQVYNHTVPMGSSIGQINLNDHSATVGGKVKLANGRSYALTNHHVIRNDKLDDFLSKSGGKNAPLKLNSPGFSMQSHILTCPSNDDNSASIELLKSLKNQWETQKGDDTTQELVKTLERLKKAETMDRVFGAVSASSGLRSIRSEKLATDPKTGKATVSTGKPLLRFLLDWSLLAISPHRGMDNNLPKVEQNNTVGEAKQKLLSGKACSYWTALNDPKCHILRDEVRVGKFGRTTGFTYGQINPVPTLIDPVSQGGQFKPFSDQYSFTLDDCGAAMCFVDAKSRAVVDSGDSGSVVLHAPSGDWLGLIFGMTNTGAALFTPIDIVFRDIQNITGFEVIEPAFNPD